MARETFIGMAELDVSRMPFGKHRGRPIRSLPRDYIEWFLRTVEGCEDIRHSMTIVLAEWDSQKRPGARKKVNRRRKTVVHGKPNARARLNEKVYGDRPEGWGQPNGEPCPFDTDVASESACG